MNVPEPQDRDLERLRHFLLLARGRFDIQRSTATYRTAAMKSQAVFLQYLAKVSHEMRPTPAFRPMSIRYEPAILVLEPCQHRLDRWKLYSHGVPRPPW
jgi:hypothetical protein